MPLAEYDDICRVCGTYCPEGGGVHAVCDKALQAAYAEGRADQRAEDAKAIDALASRVRIGL